MTFDPDKNYVVIDLTWTTKLIVPFDAKAVELVQLMTREAVWQQGWETDYGTTLRRASDSDRPAVNIVDGVSLNRQEDAYMRFLKDKVVPIAEAG